jgi:hypothetical protein
MAKLTRKQESALRGALNHLQAARDYIFSDRHTVCTVDKQATTTLHYTRASDDRVLYEVAREYGSDLCRIDTALGALLRFLDTHTK